MDRLPLGSGVLFTIQTERLQQGSETLFTIPMVPRQRESAILGIILSDFHLDIPPHSCSRRLTTF